VGARPAADERCSDKVRELVEDGEGDDGEPEEGSVEYDKEHGRRPRHLSLLLLALLEREGSGEDACERPGEPVRAGERRGGHGEEGEDLSRHGG